MAFLLLVIIGLHGYQASTAVTPGSSQAAQLDARRLCFVFSGPGIVCLGSCPVR